MIASISLPLVALCSALLSEARTLQPRDTNVADVLSLYDSKCYLADSIKGAMLGSIRTSWEQGTAADGVLEIENPEYSVFAESPFTDNGDLPAGALRLAFSAAVRQTADGRLSQNINDAEDGAALDGASSGSYTLLGKCKCCASSRPHDL